MKTSLRLAAAALLAATACTPAMAQNILTGPTGYQAGDILVHLSAIGVLPQNFDSHVTQIPGAHVNVSNAITPEIDGSYFLTPHWDLNLIAATAHHYSSVTGGALGNTTLKVGSTWVLPPTLTAQYHFAQIGMVRPYAGLGLTVAFFYGNKASHDLQALGGGNWYTSYSTGVGPALNAGFDVPVHGNWSLNVDVKQMFIVTAARIRGPNGARVHALTELSPTVVGVGIGYKF